MKRIYALISFCLVLCCLFGCASTKIEGITKPGTNLRHYNNILIHCNFDNLQYRKQLETEFQKQFSENGIRSIKSIDLFPPLKDYSPSEITAIAKSSSASLILEIKLQSLYTNKGDSSSFFIPMGGFFFGSGSSEIKLTVVFDITIRDIPSEEILFRGTATSEDENDNLSKCLENIFESLSEELVEKYFLSDTNS